MKQLSLGRAFGIPIAIHWTFILIILYIVIIHVIRGSKSIDIFYAVIFVLCIFACVVLHELGHALAARRYGISTRSITLLPIGGVASLEKIPEEPKQELVVSAAGPLVNLLIAIIIYIYLSITGNITYSIDELTVINASNFIYYLMAVNLMLIVFNMIPAFPMDGGRIFRAFLSFYMPREKATHIAMMTGSFFAIIFVFLGLISNPFLILIAVFVFLGARAEYDMVRSSTLLADFKVKDIVFRKFKSLQPDNSMQEAVDALLSGQDHRFLVMQDGKLQGVITKRDILKAIAEKGMQAKVKDAMSKNVKTLSSENSLKEVYELIKTSQYSFFPVIDDNKLAGVLEKDNLLEFISIRGILMQP